MARKTQQRSLRQPEITIIGEGATERFYFTNLRRLKGYRYTCKPRNFTEQSLDSQCSLFDEGLYASNDSLSIEVAIKPFIETNLEVEEEKHLFDSL